MGSLIALRVNETNFATDIFLIQSQGEEEIDERKSCAFSTLFVVTSFTSDTRLPCRCVQ